MMFILPVPVLLPVPEDKARVPIRAANSDR